MDSTFSMHSHSHDLSDRSGRHDAPHRDHHHRDHHDHQPPGIDAVVLNVRATWVYFGDGRGQFAREGNLGAGPAATTGKLELADFDRDGRLDVALAHPPHSTAVWLNQGDRNFSLASEFGPSVAIAAADVNGDRRPDLIVANPDTSIIRLGDGTGQFTDSGQVLAGIGNFGDAALADLNHDGSPDAVLANTGGPSTVYLNDGRGHFTDSGQRLPAAPSVAIGDLNGDCAPDLFLGLNGEDQVWFNDGTGRFANSGQRLPGAVRSSDVALGDVDGDGSLDAVVASRDPIVYLNDGAGRFRPGQEFAVGDADMVGVALADLDGNGTLDVLFANFTGSGSQVWLNDGEAQFEDSGVRLSSDRDLDVALGELDDHPMPKSAWGSHSEFF